MDCCDEKEQVSDAKKFDQGSFGGIILIGRKRKIYIVRRFGVNNKVNKSRTFWGGV